MSPKKEINRKLRIEVDYFVVNITKCKIPCEFDGKMSNVVNRNIILTPKIKNEMGTDQKMHILHSISKAMEFIELFNSVQMLNISTML